MSKQICRFCGEELDIIFADLNMSPMANSYKPVKSKESAEKIYPLKVHVCKRCFLAQLQQYETPDEIFSDYAYFSSYSTGWLEHCERYTTMITEKLGLSKSSYVIEIASNDGYLLKNFVKENIPALGIEPAANVAQAAKNNGVETIVDFFGVKLAEKLANENKKADLLIGNNVLAHVPNINDFVKGLKILLKDEGVITIEFPHIINLIRLNQFDTIYHEHFSYLSFITVCNIFSAHGLEIYDVEKLNTHGGSLRIYAGHKGLRSIHNNVNMLVNEETEFGIENIDMYTKFNENVKKIKREILSFFIKAKDEGKKIAAYGAPAKGVTLLNYCGIGNDFIDFTVDKNINKQNCYLPGLNIEIFDTSKIEEEKPDYIVILPWNLKDEIMEQCSYVRQWGARFVTLIPGVEII